VKVALITTPPAVRSGIADYTRHLLPYLQQHCDVELYVQDGQAGEEVLGLPTHELSSLTSRGCDQILYQLGNEAHHGFMARAIKRLGGIVMQHDWVLFDMACAAYPALTRGGVKGSLLAAREGGRRQLQTYLGNLGRRRRLRVKPLQAPRNLPDRDGFLAGWYEAEGHGRWIADEAVLAVSGANIDQVRVLFNAPPGRTVVAEGERGASATARTTPEQAWGELRLEFGGADRARIKLHVDNVKVTREQRAHGDPRRLAAFVERIVVVEGGVERDLPLEDAPVTPIPAIHLASDRFQLPLNHSITRGADGFIVHSEYVANHIRSIRGKHVPIGLVHHGAERRWNDEPQADVRARLGLSGEWLDAFMLTSFGGVQAHKRVDKVLAAVALARQSRPGLRLAMVGALCSESFDAQVEAERLGLTEAVHFAGFVSEEDAWAWLHAGDLAINLRGPTSGGTSGGIFQAFAQGRPVIASNAGEQRELPDSCTIKVPLGEGEVEGIAAELVRLHDDRVALGRLQKAARDFVDDECHWSHCAAKYAEYLAKFPRPRVASSRTRAAL
jgi:glycosyltransferase involved in cell wall biosynthesis